MEELGKELVKYILGHLNTLGLFVMSLLFGVCVVYWKLPKVWSNIMSFFSRSKEVDDYTKILQEFKKVSDKVIELTNLRIEDANIIGELKKEVRNLKDEVHTLTFELKSYRNA